MTITTRIDAITQIPPSHFGAVIPVPRSVKIELTGQCNFKCWFCATGQNLREKSHMDTELFRRLALEMREAGVEEMGLFYLGESFLYPGLVDAVYHAKTKCEYPYVFLTTNGFLASPERLQSLFRAGLDSLKFSFNWADEVQCIEVTRVNGFKRVVENIRNARLIRDKVRQETGHHCGLYASSIRFDGEQQARMEKAVQLIEPYVDEHYWLPLYNQAGLVGAEGKAWTAGNRGRVGALRDPIPCWAVFTEGHITYDGKLSACCFDHDGRFSMGDLTKQPFKEAWNSMAFQKLRAAHLTGDVTGTACERCIAYAG